MISPTLTFIIGFLSLFFLNCQIISTIFLSIIIFFTIKTVYCKVQRSTLNCITFIRGLSNYASLNFFSAFSIFIKPFLDKKRYIFLYDDPQIGKFGFFYIKNINCTIEYQRIPLIEINNNSFMSKKYTSYKKVN